MAAVKAGKLDMAKGHIVLNEKVYRYTPKAYPNALDKIKTVPPLIDAPDEYII